MNNHIAFMHLVNESYERKDDEIANIEFIHKGDVFVFRGTDEFKDIITDVRFIPWTGYGIGYSPAGFVKIAEQVTTGVLQLATGGPLTLIGHSEGAAIALLVGAMALQRGYLVHEIVTFGCPRIGRLKILKDVNVTMYKNGNDFVTMLPPIFLHCRKQTKIGSKWSWHIVTDHFRRNYTRSMSNGSTS